MASHEALRTPGTAARSASAEPSARPTRAARGPAGSLARLQRTLGNRATGQLIQRCRDGHTCAECAQRASPWDEGLTQAPGQRQGVGQPLDPAVRTFTESGFGADFADVRVHTDAHAAGSARGLHALAYTIGRDIFFAAGRYQPARREGQRLLAHELTHVLQQRGATGEMQTTTADGADEGRFERQAEEQATRVLAGQAVDPAPIQRQLGLARVQRQGPPPTSWAGRPSTRPWSSPPPPTPGPPPVTTNCSYRQVAMLTSHLNDARTWVNHAESMIRMFGTGNLSRADAAMVARALMDNFHTSALADVGAIQRNFLALSVMLAAEAPSLECVSASWCRGFPPWEPDAAAYVRGATAGIRRMRDINVCPVWFDMPYLAKVTTLIHERAHQYPGAGDPAYEHQPEYATLPPEKALYNADSYAVTARQIFHRGTHGPQARRYVPGPSLRSVLEP